MRATKVTVFVPCVCLCVYMYVCVSVRSFLPPHASIPRNIGMYVFFATRKNFYNLFTFHSRNMISYARNYGVLCDTGYRWLASKHMTS